MEVLVIKGIEGSRVTYVGKLTYSELAESFTLISTEGPTDEKRQRETIKSRTNNIYNYLAKNDDFIFPEVVAILEELEFEVMFDTAPSFGKLTFSDQALSYLVDGQGRLTGIQEVLKKRPELSSQTIDIKFVKSEGLEKDQQIFADINQTPTKASGSISITFDSRAVLNQMSKAVLNSLPELKPFICYEKASVSLRSNYVWTVNQFNNFVLAATGLSKRSCDTKLSDVSHRGRVIRFLTEFLSELIARSDIINRLTSGQMSPQQLKEETVVGTAVFLEALGIYARTLQFKIINDNQKSWTPLDGLNDVALGKSEKEWVGRCLDMQNKFVKNQQSVLATASHLTKVCHLPLTEELERAEKNVMEGRNRVATIHSPSVLKEAV